MLTLSSAVSFTISNQGAHETILQNHYVDLTPKTFETHTAEFRPPRSYTSLSRCRCIWIKHQFRAFIRTTLVTALTFNHVPCRTEDAQYKLLDSMELFQRTSIII